MATRIRAVGSVCTWKLRIAVLACCAFSSLAFAAPSDSLPLDITPEGVKELERAGVPCLLINAGDPAASRPRVEANVRIIYFAPGPDSRAAREMALKDRSPAAPPKPSAGKKKKAPPPALEIHDASQRLVGTPLDWQQLQVPVADAFLPKAPLKLTPRALADAINDGVDLQLVDLRPRRYPGVTNPPRDEVVPFPGALVLPLHESDQLAASLSKRRWTVFIDSGNGLAESVAERFFKDGFVLVGVLEGDYPAWVAATDR